MRHSSWLVLSVLAACAGCRTARNQGPADRDLAAFVPESTLLLAGFHMQELVASPVFQKLQAQHRIPRLEGLAGQGGFDPQRDVNELLAAYDGKDTVLIARGAFHVRVPDGTPKAEYKGRTIYGGQEGAFVLVDQHIALAGTAAGVRSAIDQRASGGSAADLLRRAQALPARSQIWAVGDSRLAGLLPEAGNLANLRKFLGPMDDLSLVAEVGESLHATLTGTFRTEQDAKDLSVAARGILGLGRLSMPPDQPDLTRLYDTVSVEQRQRTIKLEAYVPADLVDKLSALGARR